ncbi:MAG: GNAT family N-acetyltransferase [Patescibacteria group bacterium]|nr:GNAT family N-acetyltransferase [Patescibacteria group bacterium]
MIIRNAKKTDIAELLSLMEAMVEHHTAIDGYYKPFSEYAGLEEEVTSWFSQKDMLVLIAEENGRTAGYAQVSVEPAPAYAAVKKIGVVYDLFVREEFRRQGIARLLFAEAMAWFQKKKVKNIELSVDARNASGVAFWTSMGFEPFKLRMRMDRTDKK